MMKKRILISLLSAVMLIVFMPVMSFAATDISEYTVLIQDRGQFSYTGSPIEPKVLVLTEAPDYAEFEDYNGTEPEILDASNYGISYENNVEPGEGTITITGKNACSGTIVRTLYISQGGMDLTVKENSDSSVTISGIPENDVKSVVVCNDDYTLTEGTEYEVGDGFITLKADFVKGKTGFQPYSYEPEIKVETSHYLGFAEISWKNIRAFSYNTASALVYNGKNRTISVKMTGLTAGRDYKVVYAKSTRKNVGTYKYTIQGIGKYYGKIQGSFEIIPKATSKVTASRTKKKATVKWRKVAGCSGYEVTLLKQKYDDETDGDPFYYVTYKKAVVKGANNLGKTFKNVSKSKYDRAQVRAYKIVSGKKYYSKVKIRKF